MIKLNEGTEIQRETTTEGIAAHLIASFLLINGNRYAAHRIRGNFKRATVRTVDKGRLVNAICALNIP